MKDLERVLNKLIEFGLLETEEEEIVRRELLEIEIHLSPKSNYILYIEKFNEITKKKYKPDLESRKLFYENEFLYSLTDRLQAVKNATTDPWVQESNTILSPKWILKPDNTAKYMNYRAPEKKQETDNKDLSKNDYGNVIV